MNRTKDEKSVNMKLNAETWKKVGVLAATEETTKRNVVEKAVELYFQNKKV